MHDDAYSRYKQESKWEADDYVFFVCYIILWLSPLLALFIHD